MFRLFPRGTIMAVPSVAMAKGRKLSRIDAQLGWNRGSISHRNINYWLGRFRLGGVRWGASLWFRVLLHW